MQDYFGLFQFLSDHIHVAGWIVLISFAWKISTKWNEFITNLQLAEQNAKDAKDTINTMATNHLPHLQEAMDKTVDEIKGLRADLLQYALTRKD